MTLTESLVLILFIVIFITIIIVKIKQEIEDKKELKRLRETPIKVNRYTYKVYLNDGGQYSRVANSYVVYSFDRFIDDIVLCYNTLRINKSIVVNTENIVKAEMLDCESKMIKPIMGNKWYDEKLVDKIYSVEEVLGREIKKEEIEIIECNK